MKTATKTLTLATMRKRWLGRSILSSTDHGFDDSGRHLRPVTDIHYSHEFDCFFAFAGEHHRANTLEALDRRLHQLAV